jgi:16S rRNA processing protein RimM
VTGTIRIGKITGASGVKGEIKLFHDSGERERIAGIEELFFRAGQGAGAGSLVRRKVLAMRYRGKTPILLVEGIGTRSAAEALVGAEVYAERQALRPLDEDSYYVEAIVGCAVVRESGERIGEVTGVLDNPAHDILRIAREDGEELLLPMIDRFVLSIDTEAKVVTVRPPDGLAPDPSALERRERNKT